MAETTSIYALPQVDATLAPSGQYAKMAAGGLDFITNYYGAYTPSQLTQNDFVQWLVETSGNEGTGTPGFRFRQTLDGPATLRYRMIGEQTNFVRHFASMYIGTLRGRDETSGVIGSQTSAIPGRARMDGTSLQSQMWDLETARALTGYPCRADQMPGTKVRWDLTRVTAGIENLFFDFYFNDVSDGANYDMAPFGNLTQSRKNLRVPHRDYLNTVNGIDGDFTRSWNLNVWPALPVSVNSGSTRPDGGWAGGLVVDDIANAIQRIDGRDHHVIFKRENNGSQYEFDYIGLVFANEEMAGELDPLAYRDWLINVWPSILQSSAKAQQIWNLSRVKPWGAPRMPSGDMIIEGVNFGNEGWYSAASGDRIAEIRYDRFEIEVDGIGTFGWDHSVPDTGAGTGGSGTGGGSTTGGTNQQFELTLDLGDTSSEIPYTTLHSSGAQLATWQESNPDSSTIIRLDPAIVVRADAVGTNRFNFTLTNGETGFFDITVVDPATNTNTGSGGTTGSTTSQVRKPQSTRQLQPGSSVTININLLPQFDQLQFRSLLSKTGPAIVSMSDDGKLLTITIPETAERGATGTIGIQ